MEAKKSFNFKQLPRQKEYSSIHYTKLLEIVKYFSTILCFFILFLSFLCYNNCMFTNFNFKKIDKKIAVLNSYRPLSSTELKSLKKAINLEWTYNSNGIEGNTLTLKETKVVLEGITVGGKTLKEHLEAINHKKAIEYLDSLINSELTEFNIKELHQLILKGIDDENAGRYRLSNVTISGAIHKPPDYTKVSELMEKLLVDYKSWSQFHPIIKSSLLHIELVGIHPFVDGNGRTSRLLMNLELMKSGYVPVIIRKADRLKYYEVLDIAHTTGNYEKFVELIAALENEMLDRYIKTMG